MERNIPESRNLVIYESRIVTASAENMFIYKLQKKSNVP